MFKLNHCMTIVVLLLSLILIVPMSSTIKLTNMDYIEDDIDVPSSTLIPWRQINFISPSQSLSQSQWWHSEPLSFSAKGMEHLYLIMDLLLDWLQPPGLPPDVVKKELFEDPEPIIKQNRTKLLSHFWGIILTATLCFCLAVIVPLIGFLICCCWCNSGSSSSRAKHSHSPASSESPRGRSGKKYKKYKTESACDPCCRSFFGVNLFILLLLISFFVICAFVTNEYLRNGLHELPKTLNQSMDDVQLYLNNTQHEVNTLLRTNFGQLEQELGDSLDKSGLIVKNRLALVSQAIALDNLTEIVTKLEAIHSDIRVLSVETTGLRGLLHQLQSGLNKARRDLEQVFAQCSHPIC